MIADRDCQMFYWKVCWLCGSIKISKNSWIISWRSDDCEVEARPLHFTDAEVNRISSLFDAACHIGVESGYSDRFWVNLVLQ